MATVERAQHVAALERANEVRLRRAAIKRDVKAGTKTIRDVLEVHDVAGVDTLEDVDPVIASMPVGDLLALPYRWGVTRARKLLAQAAVPESKTLGELTARRRRTIVALFEGRVLETEAEAQRKRDQRQRRLRGEAERQARKAAEVAARGPDALDVECPYCGANPGEPCATYDPVRDKWHEPAHPHGPRVRAAAKRA